MPSKRKAPGFYFKRASSIDLVYNRIYREIMPHQRLLVCRLCWDNTSLQAHKLIPYSAGAGYTLVLHSKDAIRHFGVL